MLRVKIITPLVPTESRFVFKKSFIDTAQRVGVIYVMVHLSLLLCKVTILDYSNMTLNYCYGIKGEFTKRLESSSYRKDNSGRFPSSDGIVPLKPQPARILKIYHHIRLRCTIILNT